MPLAITLPWSMTRIVSASWSASSRYCVVSSTVAPSATSSPMTSHVSSRPRGSRPVVGSSSSTTAGSATSAPARSSRLRMPPEYVLAGRVAASVSRKRSISSVARALASVLFMPYSRPTMYRFSKPVRFSSTAAYWPDSPIDLRTLSGSASTSCPATHARPESGRSNVVRMRTAVVLPAPFGPSSPSTVPVGISRSMPSSARVDPKVFTSASARTATSDAAMSWNPPGSPVLSVTRGAL